MNYYQIAQKYNKVFEQFVFHVRTPETEQEILELTAFFNQGKAAIDKLEHQCLQNQQLFKQIDNGTNKLMENIKELNGIYGEKTIEVELRQAAEDPYVDLLNWCRNNLLEIKGILDCISRRTDLEKYKVSLSNKIGEENRKIQNRKAGKKKIIQYFNKKSNEYYVNQSENEIHNLEQMISSVDTILNISSAMILKEEIPEFKSNKISTLGIIVDISSEKTEKEIQGFIKQFKDLESKI